MRKNLILYMAIAVLAFAGCKKETNVTTLRATIQGFHSAKDAKVYIDAQHYACWHTTGDQVILNNSTQSVTKDDNDYYHIAVAEGDQNATMFYSIYPASAVNGTSVSAQTSVTLPAVQVYQEVEGKQVVEALMAAMGKQRLEFKNLCALLEVSVTNLPSDAKLTKIEVSTTNDKVLCGTGNVTFTNSNKITLGPLTGGINGGKTIKLQFDSDTKDNGKYYVVVPPVSNTGFEINIHYRRSNNSEGAIQLFTKRLKQTIAEGEDGYSLGASEFGGITVNMTPSSTPEEHLPGAYSVSETLQVYFSRGNLKYDVSHSPKWFFEPNQTSYTATDQTNSGVSYTGYMPFWCDDNMTEPLLHDNSYKGTPIDYGRFAAPATTSGAWRTLTRDEWNFLVSRPNHQIGSPLGNVNYACYAYVQVNGVNGMMLFPDLFEWPATVDESLIPGDLNAASSNWNGINYLASDWAQLEDAGCIFLPAAGWTKWIPVQFGNQGYYWSITPKNTNSNNNKDAYYFFFNNTNTSYSDGGTTSNSPTANQYSSYGHGYMVRLVYDPNATPWTSSK